jgi:hypothetical protein
VSEGSCIVAYAMNGFAMEQGRHKTDIPHCPLYFHE